MTEFRNHGLYDLIITSRIPQDSDRTLTSLGIPYI